MQSGTSPASEGSPEFADPGNAAGQEKRGHGCFFYGCITGIVLVVLAGGGLFALFMYGRGQVGPYCEEYLSAVERGDYEAAYQLAGDRWKQEQPFEQYVEFEKTMRQGLGQCLEKRLAHVNIGSHAEGAIARIVYNAQFENGECVITFALTKQEGRWVVQGVHYASPALLQVLTCPSCGATQKILSKFCADCGQPMRPAADSEDAIPPADKSEEPAGQTEAD